MRIVRRISGCIFIGLSGLLPLVAKAQAEAKDSVVSYPHQLRIGIDISRPIINLLTKGRYMYEVQADYSFRKEFYGVFETGLGGYQADYEDLSYKTTNFFARVGFDKGVMRRLVPTDWDGGLFGLRYGIAALNQSDFDYTIKNPVWGNTSGSQVGGNSFFHWVELTGGLRLELKRNIFAGWNIRGKFLITNTDGEELRPAFIAGYGRTDNRTAFDFNVWLMYALRWQRNSK